MMFSEFKKKHGITCWIERLPRYFVIHHNGAQERFHRKKQIAEFNSRLAEIRRLFISEVAK